MDEVNICFKILRVEKNAPFRKVRRSYNSLMLKYHPSKPLGRQNKEYFKDIVLAFDLLSKLNRFSSDFSRTTKELYDEWYNYEMSFALEKVEDYSKMNYNVFEKEFLPGCFKITKAVIYFVIFILSIAAVWYPVSEYKNGNIPGIYLFWLSVGFTIPLFVVSYRTIVDEKFITRRILTRFKTVYFFMRLRFSPKSRNSSNEVLTCEIDEKGTHSP